MPVLCGFIERTGQGHMQPSARFIRARGAEEVSRFACEAQSSWSWPRRSRREDAGHTES